MSDPSSALAALVQLGADLQSTKYYFVAACAFLYYDYILTVHDEIRYAWKGKKATIFWIFLLIRYWPIFNSIILMTSYFSPAFTFSICNRFAIFQMVDTVFTTTVSEILLLLRVYALSKKRVYVLVILLPIMLSQFGFAIFVLTKNGNNALPLPPIPIDPFHLCVLSPNLSIGYADTAYIFETIAFDAIVFFMTIYHTYIATRGTSKVMQTLRRDGVVYFIVVFTSNLLWALLTLCARPALKNIHAQPALMS